VALGLNNTDAAAQLDCFVVGSISMDIQMSK